MNLCFIVPFLDYFLNGIHGSGDTIYTLKESGISPGQILLFSAGKSLFSGNKVRADEISGELPVTIGWALLIMLVTSIYLYMLSEKSREIKAAGICALLSLVALWMTSDRFPWYFVYKYIPLLFALFGGTSLQFPWRYMVMATVFSTMAACFSMMYMKRQTGFRKYAGTIMALTCLITAVQSGILMSQWVNSNERALVQIKDADEREGTEEYEHYHLEGSWASDRESGSVTASDEGLIVDDLTRKGFSFRAVIQNEANKESYLEFPVWNYKGYIASSADGSRLTITDGEHRRVKVTIPENFDDEIHLRWSEPWYWRVAEVVSLISMLALLTMMIRHKRISVY